MLYGHEGVAVLALLEVLLGGLKSFARIFDERFCVRGAVGAIFHAASAGGGLKRFTPEPGLLPPTPRCPP